MFHRQRLFSSVLATVAAASLVAEDPRLPALEKLAGDPSPAVRLEAVRALAKIKEPRAAEIALSVLESPMDPTLDYALWLTVNDLAPHWIAAFESGAWKPEGREKQLEFALRALPPSQASGVLSRALASRPIDPSGTGPWIELIGMSGGPAELKSLVGTLATGQLKPEAAARAARALSEALRLRKLRVEGDSAALGALLDHASAAVRQAAAVWSGLAKDAARVPRLAELLALDPTPAVREACLAALRQTGGAAATQFLRERASQGSNDGRISAIGALAALDVGAAISPALDVAQAIEDEAMALALWRGLLAQKGSGKTVAETVAARYTKRKSWLSPTVSRAGMRVAREGGRNETDLVVALAGAAGIEAEAQNITAQWMRDLAAKATSSGDPARGEMIYRRDSLGCVTCHAIGGVGGKVGPDMTSIGASAQPDYLVESVLQPNVKIKEGYHSVVLSLKDGSEMVGTLARETPQEIVLRNAAGAEQPIPKADVAKREQGTASIMPAGLIDALNEQEQTDLFAFLARLGKPGDFDASRGGVARRWHVAFTVHTDAQAGNEGWPLTASYSDKRWIHTTSLVSGVLSRAAIEAATRANIWVGRLAVFAATDVDVSPASAGKPLSMRLAANPAAELWVGGRKVGGPGAAAVTLPQGRHRVLVKLDPKDIPNSLRLDSADVAFVLE
ncbi:MAG: HEAT repeat domain-containing protein [Verrucomicrobiota bacterium]|jgi:putative heme-binding domain-containing protein